MRSAWEPDCYPGASAGRGRPSRLPLSFDLYPGSGKPMQDTGLYRQILGLTPPAYGFHNVSRFIDAIYFHYGGLQFFPP